MHVDRSHVVQVLRAAGRTEQARRAEEELDRGRTTVLRAIAEQRAAGDP